MTTDQSPPARPKRRWFQFSIKALLGTTTFVAIGCAALLNASEWWASVTCTLVLGVLLVAVLRSVFCRGPSRAFWLGFAILGWAYVLLIFWPMGPDPTFPCQRHLLTTKVANWAYFELLPLVRTPPSPPVPSPPMPVAPLSGPSRGAVTVRVRDEYRLIARPAAPVAPKSYYPDYTPFLTIAEWLWTFVLAIVGGVLARCFYAPREKES